MTNTEEIAENLLTWMDGTEPHRIDAILEFLSDNNLLNEDGEELEEFFWKEYIRGEY